MSARPRRRWTDRRRRPRSKGRNWGLARTTILATIAVLVAVWPSLGPALSWGWDWLVLLSLAAACAVVALLGRWS